MKRILRILGILILLVVAAAVLLPVIFKDRIIATAKEEINKSVNATVDFGDIDLSLFSSFPNFRLGIDDLSVDGVNEFEGIRLAEIGNLSVDIDLFSVIMGDQYQIDEISISDSRIHVLVDTSGAANYDIAKEAEDSEESEEVAEESSFALSLKRWDFDNLDIIYEDREGNMLAVIKKLDQEGSGDFSNDIVDIRTSTSIDALTFKMDDVAYLSRVTTKADFDLNLDQTTSTFTFGDNSLSLNELLIKFAGSIAMPGDDLDMDLQFEAPDNSFKSLLSLIPAIYYEDFEKVQTKGNFSFTGAVKGKYSETPETYPAYDLALLIEEASFRYPDLPAGVEAINVDLKVVNKTDDLDGTVVSIPKAAAVVAGSPIKAKLNLSTPISDPDLSAYLSTDFDLANIGKVVPASGYDYKGGVKADLDVAARMSDIDSENFEAVKAEGQLVLSNILLKGDSLPYDVAVSVADLAFSPQYVSLNAFEAKLGESDISMKGQIDNLLPYVLDDQVLEARFDLGSQLIDLNSLAGSSEEEETAEQASAEDTSALEIIRLPQNVDAALSVNIAKVLYDDLNIEQIKGSLILKEGEARFDQINMNLLGGSLGLNGSYNSLPSLPEVDLDLEAKDFSFKESFDKLETVQKLAPIMANTTGNYDTKLTFSSILNSDMSPDLASIVAKGWLRSQNLSTSGNALRKMSELLQNPSLASLDVDEVNLSYEISDGRLSVEPFEISAGSVNALVSGSSGLDQTLDYDMDIEIPVANIGSSNMLSALGVAEGGKADLKLKIGGTTSDPKVTTSLTNIAGNIIDNAKDLVKDKVDETKKEAVDKVNEQGQKLVDEAEKKGDALVAEAEKKAAAVRAEAKKQADRLRAEGDRRAQQAIDEAGSNPLKAAAAKKVAEGIKKEAYESADKVEAEANQRADKLVADARAQKEQMVNDARQKAQLQNP